MNNGTVGDCDRGMLGRQKTNIVVIWPYDALIGINNHNVIGLAGLVTKHLPPPFL